MNTTQDIDQASEIEQKLAEATLEAIENARLLKNIEAADIACRLTGSYFLAAERRYLREN